MNGDNEDGCCNGGRLYCLHADEVYGTIYIDLQDKSKGKMKNITDLKNSSYMEIMRNKEWNHMEDLPVFMICFKIM